MDRPPGLDGIVEARQRWRIVFARDEPGERPHREVAEAWIAALLASPLPLPRAEGRSRPPLTFAAPLPTGIVARREYADLQVADRLPIADVRAALAPTLPPELRLVDLHDVWLGAPALQAAVRAADYRVELAGGSEAERVAAAASGLLETAAIVRERSRGGRLVTYDLRPLVERIAVEAGPPVSLLIRTRFDRERGTGRPEEVVAALGEAAGQPLEAVRTIREELILGPDPRADPAARTTCRGRLERGGSRLQGVSPGV